MKRACDEGTFYFNDLKRQCVEIQKGVKRAYEERDDPVPKRQQTENHQSGHMMMVEKLREDNRQLRAEADEKDRLIKYGAGEIKRLNAELLTSKHQLKMMEDYVAVMEGRKNDMPFYVS